MKKYDGVLKRVRELEEKKGIVYAKPDGRLYKTLKVFYTIIFIWSFLMNLLTIMSFMMRYSNIPNKTDVRNIIITVTTGTAVLIIGYILNCVKCYLSSAILTIASVAVLLPVFTNIFKDSLGLWGLALPVYWRYLGPLTLIAILIIWMTVIAIRAQKKTDAQYKKIVENLFNEQSAKNADGKAISEDEWDDFLKKYNTDEG